MELKYQFMIYAGIVLACLIVLLYFLKKKKQTQYQDGKKLALLNILEDDPYYKRRKITYRIVTYVLLAAVVTAILSSCVLLARPYQTQTITEQKYSRDIILCIDISTSVDYLNKNVVGELIETVENLKSERFGILIFNTSPVLVSPLTDDYEYTIEQLKTIEKALSMRIKQEGRIDLDLPDNYFYYNEFISGGTLVGNEERGSSLIGDGLASSIYHFSKDDEDRTKVIIFTTDNDLEGQPFVTLPQAAQLCEENDIVVYGVGTKEMEQGNLLEMKQSVEQTGGKFYLEEESGSFESIVSDIEKTSTSLTEGRQYVVETEFPDKPFIVLLVSVMIMFCSMKYSKR